MSKIVSGKNSVVSFWDDENEEYKPIGCETSHDFNEEQEINEGDPNKCDDSTPKTQGEYSYDLSIDGQVLSEDDDDFDNKANYEWLRKTWKESRDEKEELYFKISNPNEAIYGHGYITSLSSSADADSNMTFSLDFEGIDETSDEDPKEEEG